ncbi:MAG: DUF1850 domain-containing protein [Paracoccaceae bacterium]
MSGACLIVGTTALALATGNFDLSWRHSVEKVEWRERWSVSEAGLSLTEAAVKGSGAGMDPGPGARLEDGWWVWSPDLPAQPAIHLAASGATGGGWRLCADGVCREFGRKADEALTLRPCEGTNG